MIFLVGGSIINNKTDSLDWEKAVIYSASLFDSEGQGFQEGEFSQPEREGGRMIYNSKSCLV